MVGWRFILGDLLGVPLASYSTIARDVGGVDRILRPSSLRMRVPSDHPDVSRTHTDGDPILRRMSRTIRAYEPVGRDAFGRHRWAIRFAGIVYQVQDVGDGDTAWSTFTAFGPMQRLSARFTGVDEAERVDDGGQILVDLVDETNLLDYTGIATSGYDNVLEATPERTAEYNRKRIGDAAIELAGAFNGFDPMLRPIHQPAGEEDGTLAALDIYARAGAERPDSLFAWGMSPNNVRRIEHTEDGTSLANAFAGFGWTPTSGDDPISTFATNPTSIAKYGRYESVEQFGDITNEDFLDDLLAEEAALRADGRELVTIAPVGGDDVRRVPRPWRDFEPGDTVPVWAGEALRGGFRGLQRVYGFGWSVADDGTTRLDQLLTSPDDA